MSKQTSEQLGENQMQMINMETMIDAAKKRVDMTARINQNTCSACGMYIHAHPTVTCALTVPEAEDLYQWRIEQNRSLCASRTTHAM